MTSRTRYSLFVLIFVAALLLVACGGGTPAVEEPAEESGTEPVSLTLYLGFRPDVQFAPYYVAVSKGFFADQGLDVTLQHESESTMARLVATNEAQFAVVSGEQVLLGRAQGLPIVYVFEWYQLYPVAVAAKAESGIEEPADLAGRSVGVPMLEGASYIGLEALLYSAGLTDADIQLEATGFTQVETLLTDRAEAVVVYATNEPIQLEAQGVDVNVMYVADYVDLVSNGIITNEQTIAEDPDLVRAVVTAFSQALQYTIENPDEAFEISKEFVEGLGDPDVEATQREVLDRSIGFWRAERLGQSDLASWQAMQEVLLQMGLLE
ncbi:MAG TPA: hypothetical protein ENI95_09245, partial [Chloroflexi bacterium]|nr:hypothetical protein [Chloroflexota bacterium]